jgi:hypothetical protein
LAARAQPLSLTHSDDAGLYTFTFAKTAATVSGRYNYTYRWNGSE